MRRIQLILITLALGAGLLPAQDYDRTFEFHFDDRAIVVPKFGPKVEAITDPRTPGSRGQVFPGRRYLRSPVRRARHSVCGRPQGPTRQWRAPGGARGPERVARRSCRLTELSRTMASESARIPPRADPSRIPHRAWRPFCRICGGAPGGSRLRDHNHAGVVPQSRGCRRGRGERTGDDHHRNSTTQLPQLDSSVRFQSRRVRSLTSSDQDPSRQAGPRESACFHGIRWRPLPGLRSSSGRRDRHRRRHPFTHPS